jgi:hypothetical protein
MLFYRGIAVSGDRAQDTIERIRVRGLLHDYGHWRMDFNDLKPRLSRLWQQSIVTTDDTKFDCNKPSWVCACADKVGATYYATKHNRTSEQNVPLLICFEARLRDVIIDGQDFLYTVFQLGDPLRAGPLLKKIYGQNIARYMDRAWATEDQSQRIAMCDLATQDDAIIAAHAVNNVVITGRHNTRFRSAFMVRTPVSAAEIVSVGPIEGNVYMPEPDVALTEILR